MNVIYRVHGAGGFYMETQSQDQAFRATRQEAAAAIPAQAHSPDRGPVSTLPAGRVGYILPGRC